MKKVNLRRARKVSLCTLASLAMLVQPITAFALPEMGEQIISDYNDIDYGILGLDYNKIEVLANQGETISNYIPKQGRKEDGTFILIENTKKSLSNSPIDISVVESNLDRTYPGAVLLADQDFLKNKPTIITCERQPITISLDLPGLESENSLVVDNPTYANVSSAVDTIVDKWANNNQETHTLPTRTQYNESMVYSKTQIAASLHMDDKQLSDLFSIDFDSVVSGEKQIMIASYKQIFYTASATLPAKPSDLFAPGVTFEELQLRGVSEEAPPILVNNVEYGRTIYVKFETTSRSIHVKEAFEALIKGIKVGQKAEFDDVYNKSTFTAVVFGGDSKTHNKIISTDYEQIRDVIVNNSEFSLKNPGYPISYTTSFVKDNSVAAIHNTTDYIETKITEYKQCKLKLYTSGAYIARFNVQWDELSYDKKGNEVLTHKTWAGNDRDRTASFSDTILLDGNVRNLTVKAIECTGLAWEWWRTVVNEKNMPLGGTVNVSIGGTTLNPCYNISYQ